MFQGFINLFASNKTRLTLVVLFVLSIGVLTTVYLVGQQQDIRQRASGTATQGSTCSVGSFGQCGAPNSGLTCVPRCFSTGGCAGVGVCCPVGWSWNDSSKNCEAPSTGNNQPPSSGQALDTPFQINVGASCGCPTGIACQYIGAPTNGKQTVMCVSSSNIPSTGTGSIPSSPNNGGGTTQGTGGVNPDTTNECSASTNRPGGCQCSNSSECASNSCQNPGRRRNGGRCAALPTNTPTPTVTPTRKPTPTPTTPSVTLTLTPTPKVPTSTPVHVTQAPTSNPCQFKSQGDANCDGKVNIADFGIWRDEFVSKITTNQKANFNGSEGPVNIADFGIWRDGFINPSIPH